MEYNRNEVMEVSDTEATIISSEKANSNVKRQSIIVINSGEVAVTISIDKEAAEFEGIYLSPGGSWQDSRDGGYYPTQKLITAIASDVGAYISIQERVGD